MSVRGKINLVIDIVMFLLLAFISGVGFLIKFTLPPGRETVLESGIRPDSVFLGLSRLQWGDIHLFAAYALLVFLVLHLVFHAKIIAALFPSTFPSKTLRRALALSLVILSFGFLLFGFLVKPGIRKQDDHLYRNRGGKALSEIPSKSTPEVFRYLPDHFNPTTGGLS